MRPTVSTLADDAGFEILDPIENARFVVRTSSAVTPTELPDTDIYFPVDLVVGVTAREFRVPKTTVFLHDVGSESLAESYDPTGEPVSYDEPCMLEVNIAPTKLFLATRGGVEIRREGDETVIEFDGESTTQVGVRSLHDRPAGTITTTPDPEGAMKAISYLGSALKTTSPERSFPTLRGHPPLIELGEEFSVPDGVERPETGVRIEIPAEYEYVYPATSLSYYLGAEMVPADEPRLVADEFEYDLDGEFGYEETVNRVLKQTFLLDCVVRTEGFYPISLYEREQVEPIVDLDFEYLYDASLAERLEAYLSIPYHMLSDHVPEWPLTIDVEPEAESVGAMSFAANDLALVRPIDRLSVSEATGSGVVTDAIEDFHRAGGSISDVDVLTPPPVETTEHAWLGEGVPVDANKLTVDSLRRSLDVDPDTTIDVHVVCNDEQMRDEGVVEEHYGVRDLPQFDVSLHYGLTTDELRDLLAKPIDFVHFVSHVNEYGMACADGFLDATELDSVGVKAFALNACASYEQGMALIEAGSLAGVITLDEVSNAAATRVGNALARGLAAGFSLRLAVEIARKATMTSFMWSTIGNGGITLCQCDGNVPTHLIIKSYEHGRYLTEIRSYPVGEAKLGGTIDLHLDEINHRYITCSHLDTLSFSKEDIDSHAQEHLVPIEINNTLLWSDTLEDIFN